MTEIGARTISVTARMVSLQPSSGGQLLGGSRISCRHRPSAIAEKTSISPSVTAAGPSATCPAGNSGSRKRSAGLPTLWANRMSSPTRAVLAPDPHIAVEVGKADVVTAKLRRRVDAKLQRRPASAASACNTRQGCSCDPGTGATLLCLLVGCRKPSESLGKWNIPNDLTRCTGSIRPERSANRMATNQQAFSTAMLDVGSTWTLLAMKGVDAGTSTRAASRSRRSAGA